MASATPAGLKRFYLVLAALALAGVAALALLFRPSPVSIPANVTVQVADTAGFRGYVVGSPDAPIEITEYGDYQCPACASFDAVQLPDVKSRLVESGRARFRYRDFPLDGHKHSRLAAHATACADEQGKYWEAHGKVYETQASWSPRPEAAGALRGMMKALGLDMSAYDACMTSAKYAGRIQASYQEAVATGVNSTPTFLIGGRLYPGALPYDA
ncbi:MAG: DsbA family protein, partial [Gemmatimonadales bacterium]|nr:DsbA family protein [Gemmatimonadales bacterium]